MTHEPIFPETARIGRTALFVVDIEVMVDFYQDIVGLSVQRRTGTSATLGTAGRPLLVLIQKGDSPSRRQAQAGLYHIAFKVPSRAALGAALERVREHWQLDGASDHCVSEALYLTDPEDNGIEIYADHPKDEWPRADDGSVRIGTDPLNLEDVAAQSDGTAAVPPETTTGHVHLEATSIQTAREFYVETLGLRVQTEVRSALFLAIGDYHHHLGVNTWNERSQPADSRGLAWFEFVVPNEEVLATVRRRLQDADIAVTDRSEFIEFTDPDKISIRVRSI